MSACGGSAIGGKKINWPRVIYIIGIIALIIGAIDPLEGSILILIGSVLVALSTYLMHDQYRKIFLASLIMIILGVGYMFYTSSLGGFGGPDNLSFWWALLILPYPLGWLMTIVTLIVKYVKKPKQPVKP